MLEDQVTYLLQRYLGNYVRGLNKEALKISVWQGDVELTNMQLKPEALNDLNLPVRVKAGFLGSVKLKVPWSRLGQEPVIVYLDQILILAEPATQVEGCSEDMVQEIKRSRVRDMELKLIESQQQLKSEMNSSWIGSLVNTIIGNLKLSISNVHIRYEDLESNPGHPFAAGLTLQKLSAVTVDGSGVETFATGGALECIQKFVELESLAFYFDSDVCLWNSEEPWEDLAPSEWTRIFEVDRDNRKANKVAQGDHSYILQPVSGSARYTKLPAGDNRDISQPIQKAIVKLDDVTLCLSKDGYRNILKLADNFNAFNQRLKYAHYRPTVSIKAGARLWWKYGYKSVVDEMKKASGKFSWEHVLKYARLRKRYVTLYASLLKSDLNRTVIDDNEEIKEMDHELDIEVILQWRMLAHKFLEQSVEYGLLINRKKAKNSWWSFGWSTSEIDEAENKGFTEEDWERLNQIIGYREQAEESVGGGRADQLLSFFEVHMKYNASKIVTDCNNCLADLSCDGMDFCLKMYPETVIFDLKLGSYRLLCPKGLLAESKTVSDSLVGVFSYKPFETGLDWSFVAKASPCYVTYLKDSVDEIISFFRYGTAISQTVTLETVTAVQVTLDEVRRTAHQQVTRALKGHARFSLDLDIAAPKITIPTKFSPDNSRDTTKLLLDFGNLILSTQDHWELGTPDEKDIYLQFNVILRDVSAFLVDGDHCWNPSTPVSSMAPKLANNNFLPVIEKCMIVLSLQQALLENPLHPSLRISVRLPSLGFCFSPARYHRLMQVAKIFQEDNDDDEINCPWRTADIEGQISLLSWKGMTNREAIWQTRYLYLVGTFLYVLENPASKTYKHYISLRGKQVHQVPVEFTGDEHVLAVFESTHSVFKVMEDANALIIRFDNDDLRKTWQTRLQGAIYRASGSAAVINLVEISPSQMVSKSSRNRALSYWNAEKLFVTGVLDELKISFTCSYEHEQSFKDILLARENRLFEFCASGGQVELSIKGDDLFVGTILRSLEIEDQFMRENNSRPRFLARSFISKENDTISTALTLGSNGIVNIQSQTTAEMEIEEQFYEALESLGDLVDYYVQSQDDISDPGIKIHAAFANLSVKPPHFSRILGLLPEAKQQTENEEMEIADTLNSFVKVQIVSFHQDSPLYNNVDMKISVALATLSFFCHRPTILAILQSVNVINAVDGHGLKKNDTSGTPELAPITSTDDNMNTDISKEDVVKGLLGKGKSRVLFYLRLNMARAHVFLEIEDGSRLATLFQNDFLSEIKVFPSSFSIKAALGNLKISDDSLPSSHAYFWMCDMRDPNGTSFVELDFMSFSVEDDDYCGFDYSLNGCFQEVRFIYLNRFIQEVTSYFAGLTISDSRDVVKLKDQVANVERTFSVVEIEGSPALKLDVSFSKPVIIMPRETDSPDYLELDVLHITVANKFQWIDGDKSVINAVHLETLVVQVKEINLAVGSGETSGENIIEDVSGLSITIHRSLRNLLHSIPLTEAIIQVKELRAALSNREYQVITECASSNMSEAPRVLPDIDLGLLSGRRETPLNGHFSPDVMEVESHHDLDWISFKLSVDVDLIKLHLLSGRTRELPLATVQVSGAWLLYKTNSFGESFLSATLKEFDVIDDRDGTKDEFRHAIVMHENISFMPRHYEVIDNEKGSNASSTKKHLPSDLTPRTLATMLILDAKFKKVSTNLSLCVQRPHLLVALDFLLAIGEFFVPSLRTLLSDESYDDPLHLYGAIYLDCPIYYQPSAEFYLSPKNPLICDNERFDHYIYDGNGGSLLLEDSNGNAISSISSEVIFFVGRNTKLQFKNVIIKNGVFLDSCIFLGSNSSYSALEDDDVFLEGGAEIFETTADKSEQTSSLKHLVGKPSETEYIIELQAIGPEFTFYNNSKDVGETLLLSSKHFHVELDAFCRLAVKGDSTEIGGDVIGLKVESNGIRVLEPFDICVKFSNVSGRKNIHIIVSDIFMNFSYKLMMLFLAVEEDILTFLRKNSKEVSIRCSQFDKVGAIFGINGLQKCAFWRPRVPPGFAVLGDCVTPWNEPPSKGVLAVNTSFIRVKRPVTYKLIWPDDSYNEKDTHLGRDAFVSASSYVSSDNGSCSVWFPIAPEGYVALGCVVSTGRLEPSLSSSLCIMSSLVSPCLMRDCISVRINEECSSDIAFWRVANAFGSFLATNSNSTLLSNMTALELRHLLLGAPNPKSSGKLSANSDIRNISHRHDEGDQLQRSPALSSGRLFEAVASFELIWWNQGSLDQKKLSIWRPIIPEGMFYFGDIAVQGYEPPNACFVLRDFRDSGLIKPPLGFQLVGQIRRHKKHCVSLLLPKAPPGYVSLGCIARRSNPNEVDFSSLRCIRSDMVASNEFPEESIWECSNDRMSREQPFSIWNVGNEVGTFIACKGYKKPPKRFALNLADLNVSSNFDSIVVDTQVRSLSATVHDDYGSLMVPLFNASLSGISLKMHGRSNITGLTMNCTLSGRSYNDEVDTWEPLIEPLEAVLRYQCDANARGAVSQLYVGSKDDEEEGEGDGDKRFNLNISTSNINMMLQAYSSWKSLSQVHGTYRNRELASPCYSGQSMIDVHHKRDYYIIPQNKLGQDIYIRATEMRRYSSIIQMPSGDNRPIKVPVSKNLLDSHISARVNRMPRSMVIVVVYSAELPEVQNLGGGQYATAIRFVPKTDSTVTHPQSARTCGAISEIRSISGLPSVDWNEMFFFRVDCLDDYTVNFTVMDMGTGKQFGSYSSSLENIASKLYPNSDLNDLYCKWTWRELSSANSTLTQGDMEVEFRGRIKFAVVSPARPASKHGNKKSIISKRSGFLQISPSGEGPWTTVRLNYAATATCWRLGNDVVASELTVKDGTRYVNIRSLVSLTNNTDFLIDLCLKPKSYKNQASVADANVLDEGDCTGIYETDIYFETEKFIPSVGWTYNSLGMPSSSNTEMQTRLRSDPKEIRSSRLPSGWEWIDDWHVDGSTVEDSNGWVYALDVKSLRWPESLSSTNAVCNARQRKWIRHRKLCFVEKTDQVPFSKLKPGETIPMPLKAVVHPVLKFLLQLRPIPTGDHHEYCWSEVRTKHSKDEVFDDIHDSSELCVSALVESEILLYCAEANVGNPLTVTGGKWFCLSIRPTEIGKDAHLNPIHDWKILINFPLSITNYLPLPADYSLLKMGSQGQFVTCSQGRFHPAETVKIYSVDLQDPLYIILNLQGWEPIHDPILISHPSKFPSRTRTASLRSSFSGREVQIFFEQNHDSDYLMSRHIHVYVPYWICSTGCPQLVCRFLDITEWKGRKHLSPEVTFKGEETVIWEIDGKEMFEGCTIAPAINFKNTGLSMSISRDDMPHFGPIEDMSPLGDMDGFLDICAIDANGNCFQIFVTSKSCPYAAVPTKVVNLRASMTFTNRMGQDIYLKFTENDQAKTLHPYDSRVPFVYSETRLSYNPQVQLKGTEWSHPIKISKEDSFIIMLRGLNGNTSFLRVEIRGYEEGSRFLIIFRPGISNGLIRFENRVPGKTMRLCQSRIIDDGAWIQLVPFSTADFSWEDPSKPKYLDICIEDEISKVIKSVNVDDTAKSEGSRELSRCGIQIHTLHIGDTKIVRFSNIQKLLEPCSNADLDSFSLDHGVSSSMEDESQNENTPIELMIKLDEVGVSLIDHKPRELLFFCLKHVDVSYSTGYGAGTTNRFKLKLGKVQVDNQLPLTVAPVLLAADKENGLDAYRTAFRTTITMKNASSEGTEVYPYVYVRVVDTCWKLNIHEPIIWALVDFYNKIHLDRLSSDIDVMQVDPEIKINLIDVSEIRLKLSVETSPTERPHGILGIWSPILSAVGNALKIQLHLRKVMHRDRFMRKSVIIPSIFNRIKRDLIHNPLHLIFSVDVLGMTKSTFASLSKGFAELSTDGQFLQLRSKQVWSRRITGVGDGILQGTEALAQGVAFGVSGVVKKPIESARQSGLSGFAQGLGQAFLGFIVQPVSGALDFVSLTVDGISASFSRCLEILNIRTTVQRIRNPRAFRADGIIREFTEKDSTGQMILYLAEASRRLGCTDLFKEPSKYAWSDYYEDHFTIPHHRILLITNKRVMLLQCLAPHEMDKRPSKIIWDVQWENVLALELAKAGYSKPSHLIIHVKNFQKSEAFVKLVKCHATEDDFEEPQAVTICSAVRRTWEARLSVVKTLSLRVPSGQGHVQFAIEADEKNSKWAALKPRELISARINLDNRRFIRHTVNFQMIWSNEKESRSHCTLYLKQVEDDKRCSIWRPSCSNGYVSIGDVARMGIHPPDVAAVYKYSDKLFAPPVGYDLVWRNCLDDYTAPVTIWQPRAPEGFVAMGCVAVDSFEEPSRTAAFCVDARAAEETAFEDQSIWSAPDAYPWSCHLYQVQSEALHFVALRQPKEISDWKPMRISQQVSGHATEVGESDDSDHQDLLLQ